MATAASNTTTNNNHNAYHQYHQSALEHSPAHTAIKSTDPGHLTASGLASHMFAIVALGACGVFASVLAPPAAVSVIKDLTIQQSSCTLLSKAAKRGTTTTYFKKHHSNGTTTTTSSTSGSSSSNINNNHRAYEYIPHMAGYLSPLTSRSMATSARGGGFRSTTCTTAAGKRFRNQSTPLPTRTSPRGLELGPKLPGNSSPNFSPNFSPSTGRNHLS